MCVNPTLSRRSQNDVQPKTRFIRSHHEANRTCDSASGARVPHLPCAVFRICAGTVQDTTKAKIAGAAVTLVNIDTKVTQTTTTTPSGDYLFISLPPGNYTAEANKQGFQAAIVPVLLETGQLRNVPMFLASERSMQMLPLAHKPHCSTHPTVVAS